VIEPEGNKELNYNKAYRDPLGFYEDVMTQNVTQHKAKDVTSPTGKYGRQQIEFSSKITQRKVGNILAIV
jgi:hypothetical protein